MYYEKTGTAAKARTTTLNEELGKILLLFEVLNFLSNFYISIFRPDSVYFF